MADEMDQPAGAIIAAFGGIRPMAAKLGVPVSTVQGWKQRDTIPAGRMAEIRRTAAENDIQMPASGEPVIDATAITLPDEDKGEPDKGDPDTVDQDSAGARVPDGDTADTQARTSAATSAPPPAKASGGGAVIAVLALVLSVGVAGWLWWSTEGPGAEPDMNARMSALEGRIARVADTAGDPGKADRAMLAKQLEALRDEIQASSTPDLDALLEPVQTEIAALRAQIAQLEGATTAATDPQLTQQISDMEARLGNLQQATTANTQARADALAALEGKLAALDERFAGVRDAGARQEAAALDAISLTLAANQLRRDIDRGAPYRDALTTLDGMASDNAALDAIVERLAKNADTGVAALEELVFSFDEAAVSILDNAPENAESTIVDQILDRARRVVRVRRVGTDVPPESIDGRIARAELRLRDGDVAGALAILGELEGGAAEAAQPWVSRAKDYVEVGEALEAVETMTLAKLRAAGGS